MFKIKTAALINAPIEAVWDCLVKTKDYSTWNNFIKKIDGSFIEGQQIKIELLFPDKKTMLFTPTCVKVDKPNELRWVGTLMWECIFKGEHYFKLESLDNNTTKLVHAEKFSGVLSYFFQWQRAAVTEQAFKIMNNDLVNRFKP